MKNKYCKLFKSKLKKINSLIYNKIKYKDSYFIITEPEKMFDKWLKAFLNFNKFKC